MYACICIQTCSRMCVHANTHHVYTYIHMHTYIHSPQLCMSTRMAINVNIAPVVIMTTKTKRAWLWLSWFSSRWSKRSVQVNRGFGFRLRVTNFNPVTDVSAERIRIWIYFADVMGQRVGQYMDIITLRLCALVRVHVRVISLHEQLHVSRDELVALHMSPEGYIRTMPLASQQRI